MLGRVKKHGPYDMMVPNSLYSVLLFLRVS